MNTVTAVFEPPPQQKGEAESFDTRCRDDEPDAWQTDRDVFLARFLRGFGRGIERAVRSHHVEGRSVPVMRDGRLGWQMPDGTFVEGDEPPRQEVEVTIRVLGPAAENAAQRRPRT